MGGQTSRNCAIFQRLADGPALAESAAVMLRIDKKKRRPRGATVALEGRLVGPWVDELKRVVDEEPGPVTVDLRGLTFADGGGVTLLRALRDAGVKLVGGSGFVGALIGTEPRDQGGRDAG